MLANIAMASIPHLAKKFSGNETRHTIHTRSSASLSEQVAWRL